MIRDRRSEREQPYAMTVCEHRMASTRKGIGRLSRTRGITASEPDEHGPQHRRIRGVRVELGPAFLDLTDDHVASVLRRPALRIQSGQSSISHRRAPGCGKQLAGSRESESQNIHVSRGPEGLWRSAPTVALDHGKLSYREVAVHAKIRLYQRDAQVHWTLLGRSEHDVEFDTRTQVGASPTPRRRSDYLSIGSFTASRRYQMTTRRAQRASLAPATVRLAADGLAKVLGDLEARVMEVVWSLDEPSTARQVHDEVTRAHDVALLTVVTVLNKLVTKRLLKRRKISDLFHYSPTSSREEFLARTSRQMVEGILEFGPEAVAASFIDVLAEEDPEHLAELARLVRRRMRELKP